MSQKLDKPVQLLVEGREYEHVFKHISDSDTCSCIQVHDFSRVDQSPRPLLASLPKFTGFANVRVIAVIRDAEDDPAAKHDQVRDAFRRAHLPEPKNAGQIQRGEPSTGYLIVPASGPGCLETAFYNSATNQAIRDHVIECVDKCKANQNDNWRHKAIVHSMVAVSNTPEAPLALSLKFGIWDRASSEFGRLNAFLSELILESRRQASLPGRGLP